MIDRDGSAANIGIFDAVNNSLVRRVVFRNAVNTLSNAVNYDCVKTPTGVCVRQYIFKEIITIDPGSNGLIVSRQ